MTITHTETNIDGLLNIFGLYNTESQFSNVKKNNTDYPFNIIQSRVGLLFEILVFGLQKKDIEITIKNDLLSVVHIEKTEQKRDYIHRGITRKSIDLGWNISPKLDLNRTLANMNKGLLEIFIPYKEDSKPIEKTIEIK